MPFRSSVQTWKRKLKCMCCGNEFNVVSLDPELTDGVCPPCEREYTYNTMPKDQIKYYNTIKGKYSPVR